MEVHICAHISPFQICGGQSDTGTGFSLSSSLFPCKYHSTMALHFHIIWGWTICHQRPQFRDRISPHWHKHHRHHSWKGLIIQQPVQKTTTQKGCCVLKHHYSCKISIWICRVVHFSKHYSCHPQGNMYWLDIRGHFNSGRSVISDGVDWWSELRATIQ
jgi:hypothetical protein